MGNEAKKNAEAGKATFNEGRVTELHQACKAEYSAQGSLYSKIVSVWKGVSVGEVRADRRELASRLKADGTNANALGTTMSMIVAHIENGRELPPNWSQCQKSYNSEDFPRKQRRAKAPDGETAKTEGEGGKPGDTAINAETGDIVIRAANEHAATLAKVVKEAIAALARGVSAAELLGAIAMLGEDEKPGETELEGEPEKGEAIPVAVNA